MSDEIKKPKEWTFEIIPEPHGHSILWDAVNCCWESGKYHVVEISALEAAQAEIEELKQISSRNADNWVTFLKRSTALEARETELLNLVMQMREGFALMAEGEGSDYKVYMEMSRYHLNQADATLKRLGVTE